MYLDNIRITSGAPVTAAPVANFTSNSDGSCAGKNIIFVDKSVGAVSRAWTFQGGVPATSTAINPTVIYPNAGTFAVRLIVTNTAGSDTLVDSSYVTIEPAATQRLPLVTNFEPTDADTVKWRVYNPDADSTWKPVAVGSGVSANSMAIDNFSTDFYGKIDGLMSNKLKFAGSGNQKLSFNVAYGFYGTDSTVTPPVTLADSLFVLASTDCGASFRKIWAKGGKDLATVAGLVKTKFVPNGAAQWRRETLSLTPFSSEGSVILALVNKSAYGNVVYVDSVTVSSQANCPAAPQLPTSLPAICEGGTINLSTTNLAGATYNWTGPNGFTSTVRNPTITSAAANSAGTYSVTITVSGCTSPASSVAVTVNAAPSAPLATASATSLCGNDTLRLMATNVPEAAYYWTGPNSFVSNEQNPKLTGLTSAMAGAYSVRAISRGCTSAVGSVTINSITAAPSNITLQSGTTNICAGANIAMSATSVANAVYTWTGPNNFTSTVRNPTITGATTAASGTYTVVASLGACSSNVASVTINVKPAPNKPTISISASNDTLICDTIASVYQWFSNTTAIGGATQRRFKPLVNGNYSVRIGNGQNCFNTSVAYAFVISSVGSEFLNQAVSVYPNPSKGVFKLNIEHEGSASEVKVTVFDVLGKAVYSSSDRKSDVVYQQEIDLQNMPNGMYFVQIQEGDMMVTKRVLKSNQ
jgi:PKD repeat protein